MARRSDIPLTDTLIKSLPSLRAYLHLFAQLDELLPQLQRDLNQAERTGAISMARAYVALYFLQTHLDEILSKFSAVYNEMKEVRVPVAFEMEGATNIPLEEGYRVQTAETMYVSIRKGMRDQAIAWLRQHSMQTKDGGDLADLIIETINSSTLSAAGRYMLAQEGLDFPSEIFDSTFVPTTSVNKTAKSNSR